MLIEQIKKDQLQARKDKNAVEAQLLTTLIGEAVMVAKNAKPPREAPTDDEVVAVVGKFLKNNAELRAALAEQDAKDPTSSKNYIADATALAEKAVLERYQPKQLDAEEIKFVITGALHRGNLQKNKGALMKFLRENHAGSYDGKIAAQVVDQILAA